MADDLDGIKRKIRSLLVLAAEGSGATDAERDTARRLAQLLMDKMGLTEKDIPDREVARPQPKAPPPPRVVIVPVRYGFHYEFNNDSSDSATTCGTGFFTFNTHWGSV